MGFDDIRCLAIPGHFTYDSDLVNTGAKEKESKGD
jgi:hypothetical protein